ncbi:hypothetical protein F5887DRAFT_211424 [Amanita rubescens]|nr:hypothetical protein F5887DRAFT_211424 [Amanita rubescens]
MAEEIEPAMRTALEPFAQYITYLAQGKMDGYLDSIRPEELVTDLQVRLHTEPMLLLYDLGNNMEEIEKLFLSDTVHLFAISGSGKTRRTLEGLCHHWGFYISSQKQGKIGSRDFESPNKHKNVSIANRAFAMLLCARVFVLKQLLDSLPINTDPEVARKRWVLAQVLPPSLQHDEDMFTIITNSLRRAREEDMLSLAHAMIRRMDMVVNERLFVVIDEVQVAAVYLNDSFRSFTTGVDMRPVLHAFYKFLQETRMFDGIILAGTGLSMNMVKNALSSQVAKFLGNRQEPIVSVELGRFKGDLIHENYIRKYCTFSARSSDRRLIERILYWFSGRYRFTASLIELLLYIQPGSPHRILSAFAKSMTQFTITDAIDLEEEEPPLTDTTIDKIKGYGQLGAVDRLFKDGNQGLIQCLFQALMRWRIGSEPTWIPIEGDMHELVALGIGHLEKVGSYRTLDPNTNYPVYLCEPLAVLNLCSGFNKHLLTQETWITEAFRTARNTSARGTIFEEAVLLVLLRSFGGKSCALSDVFHTNQPWGSRKVTLVALKRTTEGSMQCCPVSWTTGSSDRLGFKAASPEHVLEFMNNPNGKCFVFPDEHMGPDLSFFFQDVETKELILVGLQGKLVLKPLNVSGWLMALKSITPQFFYTINTTKNDRVQYAPSKYSGLSDELMDAMQSMLGYAEYKPVIEEYRKKLRSTTALNERFESQPSRKTPKYLRIIATRQAHRRWESECSGDVGVLRYNLVEAYLGSTADVVMGSPSVA